MQSNPIPGAVLIANERARQITAEGYDNQHDDQHDGGELVAAAISYAVHPDNRNYRNGITGHLEKSIPFHWPWSYRSWKPTPNDRVRELVKAGALIAAEIDRLQRLECLK